MPIEPDFLQQTVLRSSGGHGGQKGKPEQKGPEPLRIEPSALLQNPNGREKKFPLPFRKEASPGVFSHELVADYTGFLTDHLQKLRDLNGKDPNALNNPLFAHDKRLLHLFVDESGKVKHNAVESFLHNDSGEGLATVTLLLEQKIAMRTLALAFEANSMQFRNRNVGVGNRVDSDYLLDIFKHTVFGDRTKLINNRAMTVDLFENMKANPGEAKYLLEMTGVNLDDMVADRTTNSVQFKNSRIRSSYARPRDLARQIKHDIKLRKTWYAQAGVSTSRLDSFPEQGLLESNEAPTIAGAIRNIQVGLRYGRSPVSVAPTVMAGMETTGVKLTQGKVAEYFDPNDDIRDVLGRSIDSTFFQQPVALTTGDVVGEQLDYVGNIRKFQKTRIMAMVDYLENGVAKGVIVDHRISGLEASSASAKEDIKKPLVQEAARLEGDVREIHAGQTKVDSMVTAINNVREARRSLDQSILQNFPPPPPSPADALRLIKLVRESTGSDITLAGGIVISSLVDQRQDLAAVKRVKRAGYITANPKLADESPAAYEKTIDELVEHDADIVHATNEMNQEKAKLEDIANKINLAQSAATEAERALGSTSPEKQSAEGEIEKIHKHFDRIAQYQDLATGRGIILELAEADLLGNSVDEIAKRVGGAHGKIDVRSQIFVGVAEGALGGAPDAAAIRAALPADTWAEIIAAADAAVAAGKTPAEAVDDIRTAAQGISGTLKAQIGWPENQNDSVRRKIVVDAKIQAAALARERGDINYAVEHPPFDGITRGALGEAELRSLNIDQVKAKLIDHINGGGTVTVGTNTWTTAELGGNTRDGEVLDAMRFALKRPAALTGAMGALSSDSSSRIEALREQIDVVEGISPELRKKQTAEIMKRQEQLLKVGTRMAAGDQASVGDAAAYYTGTEVATSANAAIPAGSGYTDAERAIVGQGGNLMYLRVANLLTGEHIDPKTGELTGGYMDKSGSDREKAFREFVDFLPPAEMLEILKNSFGVRDTVTFFGTGLVDTVTPITTFDQLSEEMRGRLDGRADAIRDNGDLVYSRLGKSEMWTGWADFEERLYERVKPRRTP